MGYKLKSKTKGMRTRYFYEETTEEIGLRKGKIRKEISKEVGDRDTLIADLYKISFMMVSTLEALYEIADKRKIPKELREMLNASFKKFDDTRTIMNVYIENKDYTFVDRMLDRQNKIVKILEKDMVTASGTAPQ